MAVTLIINPGSSSKKYSLVRDGRTVGTMAFESNGHEHEVCTQINGEQQKCEGITFEEYRIALRQVLDEALRTKIIENLQEITRVGVRIVAPGTYFQEHRVIDATYMHELGQREASAPLHIPHTLRELELLQQELPHAILVGVSDSVFHKDMPPKARQYSINVTDTADFDIYRFGYHGLSYASVARRLSDFLSPSLRRVVVCHVGSGMSMTALLDGVSIETTMGFSPASGLVMGSRAGDLDAGALLELMRAKNLSLFDAQSYFYTKGGFTGLAGEADFRHLLERLAQSDEVVKQAFDLSIYNFQKTVGAFAIALGGIDAIVLTATAAERSPTLRALLLRDLSWFGVELDGVRNEELLSIDGVISTPTSTVKVLVMRTHELEEMVGVTHSFV